MAELSALVTGASRGIGLGIVERLAARGYALTLAARDEGRLAEVSERLRRAGAPDVRVVAGDLADPSYVDRLAATHAATYGQMSCLVLNAGVGTAGSVSDYPLPRFDKTVAVNLRAPFQLLQACLPQLRAAAAPHPERGAKVVALSSITGVYAEAGLAAYGATKAALISLVDTLNAEESCRGVTGTAIAPAYVETDMSAWVRDRIPGEEMIPVSDIVDLVETLVGLSTRSVVANVIVSRAGANLHGA